MQNTTKKIRGAVLWAVVFAALFAAVAVGVVLALVQRLREIVKGEMDDAKHY